MNTFLKTIPAFLFKYLGKFIPSDKILHGVMSFVVLFGTVLFIAACYGIGLSALSTMVLVGGWMSGFSVEGSQYAENQGVEANGQSPMHDVSFLDATASAFACTLFAVIYEGLRAFHLLPAWANISWDRVPFWMS